MAIVPTDFPYSFFEFIFSPPSRSIIFETIPTKLLYSSLLDSVELRRTFVTDGYFHIEFSSFSYFFLTKNRNVGRQNILEEKSHEFSDTIRKSSIKRGYTENEYKANDIKSPSSYRARRDE